MKKETRYDVCPLSVYLVQVINHVKINLMIAHRKSHGTGKYQFIWKKNDQNFKGQLIMQFPEMPVTSTTSRETIELFVAIFYYFITNYVTCDYILSKYYYI